MSDIVFASHTVGIKALEAESKKEVNCDEFALRRLQRRHYIVIIRGAFELADRRCLHGTPVVCKSTRSGQPRWKSAFKLKLNWRRGEVEGITAVCLFPPGL